MPRKTHRLSFLLVAASLKRACLLLWELAGHLTIALSEEHVSRMSLRGQGKVAGVDVGRHRLEEKSHCLFLGEPGAPPC